MRRGLKRAGKKLRGEPQQPTGPVSLDFAEGGSVTIVAGTTVLAAAAQAGVVLDHFCGGQCSCGTCRIEVVSGAANLSVAAGNERMVLGYERAEAGDRLGCQARVLGPACVRIPRFF